MLFLLKRTVPGALLGLLALGLLGLGLRRLVPGVPPLSFTPEALRTGLAVLGAVLVSDGVLHGTLILLFREGYLRRYRALAGVFRDQSGAAVLTGALMAGVGEELVFRGGGSGPAFLFPMALAFGLLHHLGGELAPFTLWSVWEGTLFALALAATGDLAACMVAHFGHDLIGFGLFRLENARRGETKTTEAT
jgi:hypothetical protein